MKELAVTLFSPRLLRPLFWVLATFALVMAALPQPPQFTGVEVGDKVQHMLAFAVLTFVARLAWPRARVWQVVALLLLYGAVIEAVQMIPALHRDASLLDWIADAAAIAFAAVAAQFLIRFLPSDDTN